jgi:hypothetical protein
MNEENSTAERDSPRGIDYLSEIIKSVASSAEDQSTHRSSETSKEDHGSTQTSTSPDILSALLSNPELIANLPKIISTVKPIMEMISGKEASVKSSEATVAASARLPALSEKKEPDRRAALLCAMKPYLSPERCRTIDYVIKLSHLGDILKTL